MKAIFNTFIYSKSAYTCNHSQERGIYLKKVRIGSGAGYGDDRIEPAIDLIDGANLDYIAFECLAERTIALAQNEKKQNPESGYNHLLKYRFERILPAIKRHPTKVITNMGAANPLAAAKLVQTMAFDAGLNQLRIAVVTGDDISTSIEKFTDEVTMETNHSLADLEKPIISANAYVGAKGISDALDDGADIIITGRVADPALFIGPLIHEFKQRYDNDDFLGQGTLLGHLLECAGQVMGGYFADDDRKNVPDLWNLGFPYADFNEDGSIVMRKLATSGGLLSTETVKEQIMYEIQDPTQYFTPDVVADFSQVQVCQTAEGVKVTGATGHSKTGQLKVSVGYEDGYIIEGGISYGGSTAINRAKLAGNVVKKRIEYLKIPVEELQIDYVGVDSLFHGVLLDQQSPNEVRVHFAARTKTLAAAQEIKREIEALYTNGPAAGGGVRTYTQQIIAIASVLIPESAVHIQHQFLEAN